MHFSLNLFLYFSCSLSSQLTKEKTVNIATTTLSNNGGGGGGGGGWWRMERVHDGKQQVYNFTVSAALITVGLFNWNH